MKKSEIFKAAKDVLWDGVVAKNDSGKCEYLCSCIERLYYYHILTQMSATDGDECKELIIKEINGCSTYDQYLIRTRGVEVYLKMSNAEVQAGRLAILETLIKEAEAEENKEEA